MVFVLCLLRGLVCCALWLWSVVPLVPYALIFAYLFYVACIMPFLLHRDD